MRRNVTRSGLARKQRSQRYQIKNWRDRLPDTPAFVIGNGPSCNDFNLLLLEDYFTIGINRTFYLLDTTILMWQDISLWNTEYHRLHNTQAIKVARDIADPRRIYYNYHLKGGPFKFDQTKTHILYGRGSTGPLSVELSVSMGCKPIILIGMDCQRGEDGKSDFYGDNPHWLPHTIENCEVGLKFLKNQCPVEIINCSRTDLWPQRDLREVLEEIDPKHAMGRQAYVRQILALSS